MDPIVVSKRSSTGSHAVSKLLSSLDLRVSECRSTDLKQKKKALTSRNRSWHISSNV